MREELETLPNYGYALLGRIKNNSEESAGIQFEKKTHDALPDTTIVRIKSFDPALGAGGKYFIVSQDSAKRFIMKPTAATPDKASTFIIFRRMSRNLRDWLGISAPQANNAMMRFDKDSKDIVFDAKEKNFRDEDAKDCHWEIPEGMTIDNAAIKNRATGGCVYTQLT